MTRLDILQKIDDLQSEHKNSTKNRKIEIDQEIKNLGKLLESPQKVTKLLEKGEDLTFNEIEQLLEHVTIADVAKALGVSRSWLIGYLKRHRSPAEVKKYSPPK